MGGQLETLAPSICSHVSIYFYSVGVPRGTAPYKSCVLRVDEEGAVVMQRSSASTRQDAPPRGLLPSTCIQHASRPAPDDFANPRHQNPVSPAAFRPIHHVGRLHMPSPNWFMTGKVDQAHSGRRPCGRELATGAMARPRKTAVVDQLGMADQR